MAVRHQADALLPRLQREVEQLQLLSDVAERAPAFAISRLRFDSLTGLCQRLVELLFMCEAEGEVVVSLRHRGVELDGLAIGIDRAYPISCRAQGIGEVIGGLRKPRLQLQRLSKSSHGFRPVLYAHLHCAKVKVEQGGLWIVPDSIFNQRSCFGMIPKGATHEAEQSARIGMLRLRR